MINVEIYDNINRIMYTLQLYLLSEDTKYMQGYVQSEMYNRSRYLHRG